MINVRWKAQNKTCSRSTYSDQENITVRGCKLSKNLSSSYSNDPRLNYLWVQLSPSTYFFLLFSFSLHSEYGLWKKAAKKRSDFSSFFRNSQGPRAEVINTASWIKCAPLSTFKPTIEVYLAGQNFTHQGDRHVPKMPSTSAPNNRLADVKYFSNSSAFITSLLLK